MTFLALVCTKQFNIFKLHFFINNLVVIPRISEYVLRQMESCCCSISLRKLSNAYITVLQRYELFRRTTSNPNHVLYPYLPGETDVPYQLRTRSHHMTLINKTKFLNDADFIIRLLYKHSY